LVPSPVGTHDQIYVGSKTVYVFGNEEKINACRILVGKS
jgi:hypothetical protein